MILESTRVIRTLSKLTLNMPSERIVGLFGQNLSCRPMSGKAVIRVSSQLPVSRWHEQIVDPTVADGILDRLVHNAHRIEMKGDSMRKSRPKGNA